MDHFVDHTYINVYRHPMDVYAAVGRVSGERVCSYGILDFVQNWRIKQYCGGFIGYTGAQLACDMRVQYGGNRTQPCKEPLTPRFPTVVAQSIYDKERAAWAAA